ncbi:MAG: hypothetical protein ACPG7F_01285 [Aggregatilineales bacterium]
MRIRYLWWLVLIIGSITVLAQQSNCPVLVEEALSRADDNCNDLDRNAACYGYNLVSASFVDDVDDDFFASPADRSPIEDLRSLTTFPFDENSEQWGIALMSLQANLPNTIPGQAVTFVLMGDVEVENATAPEDNFQPADAIMIQTNLNAALRSGPSPANNTRDIIPAQTTVGADAISADGRWLRVVYNDIPGWILRTYTSADDMLLDLPVLDGEQFTPMQAFYLRTTPAQTSCEEAPESVLVLQTPEDLSVDLQVNGADFQVGSTVVIEILPPGNSMKITVLDGHVILFANEFMTSNIDLYTGQSSTICLSPPDDLGQDGNSNDRLITCGWSPPDDILQTSLASQYCTLEQLPIPLLFYPIDLECELSPFPIANTPEVVQTDAPPQPTESVLSNATPPVESPENGDADNWCNPGNPWGDGRCNTNDTSLYNWYWLCGWHLAQLDNGNQDYDDVLDDCKPATPEPPPPSNASNIFSASWSCFPISGTSDITVSYEGVPPGTVSITIDYAVNAGGSYLTTIGVPPSSGSNTNNVPDGGAADANAGSVTANPSGITIPLSPPNLGC